ncbi:MAG: acyl-CoA thioesterase [Acidiferrobacterales bacterium]
MTEDCLPGDRHPTLRVVPMPADTNAAGDIFGGWIMSHADIAGSVVASRRARGRIVTVAVNALQFRKPVFVSDLVSFYADVVSVGHTSITVDVVVYAERARQRGEWAGECVKVTEATLTYVAIDDQRRPREVPPEQN